MGTKAKLVSFFQSNSEEFNLDSASRVGAVADRLGRLELRGNPSSLGVPRAVRDKLKALMKG